LAVQWLNLPVRQAGEAFPQRRDRSCFVSSFPAKAGQVVVADSLVLPCLAGRQGNRQLLLAANRVCLEAVAIQ